MRRRCPIRRRGLKRGDTVTDGSAVVEASIGSEAVRVDLSDPAMALRNPNHGYGTAEDCFSYVKRLIEAGADEIMFLCQMGTVPQQAQLETIRNIADHVIPRLRNGTGQDRVEVWSD